VFSQPGESPATGLNAVGVLICRKSSQQVLRDLKSLVDGAMPPLPDAKYEQYDWSPPPDAESVHNAYRWRSGDQTFTLEASAYHTDGRWVGMYDLTRCPPVEVLEHWEVQDGSLVSVLRAEVVQNASGERREFWFSYLSDCPLRASGCLRAEARRLWPDLRSRANKENASVVFLSSEDCRHGSTTVYPKRNRDGEWEVPW
jgi:hypothetical protein